MNLSKAREKAGRALQSLFDGKATIYTYEHKRSDRGEDTTARIEYAVDVPCRLSVGNSFSANIGQVADAVHQSITLFLSADTDIPEGAFVEVAQNGVTREYQNSGVVEVYSTHREVSLQLVEGYA